MSRQVIIQDLLRRVSELDSEYQKEKLCRERSGVDTAGIVIYGAKIEALTVCREALVTPDDLEKLKKLNQLKKELQADKAALANRKLKFFEVFNSDLFDMVVTVHSALIKPATVSTKYTVSGVEPIYGSEAASPSAISFEPF